MILLWLLVILLAAGALAALSARWGPDWPRWIALAAVLLDFVLLLGLWLAGPAPSSDRWWREFDRSWVPAFGIHFHLALDGLSLLLLLLTMLLGLVAVLASWHEIRTGVGFFHLNLLWILAGIAGVFLAMDLFLFYFAWELMLVPMFFLIAIWGHERRRRAAIKFFLFTQLSGLLMLIAILALVVAHHASSGLFTFDYTALFSTPLRPAAATWILLGFFAAFAVKLPMFPFHTWLPDAHTEAPTAGSVVLAGLLLKTGAYGLLRFVLPLYPRAAHGVATAAMLLAAIGILYGGLLAYAQSDLKRLVAYTSVSHMGFVLLGIFAAALAPPGSPAASYALQGVVLEILCHGFSTGALFVIAGFLQDRLHTREMGRMNGLWETMPRLSGAGLFFALAAVGLPGLGNFVAEFLILLGTYSVSVGLTVAAAIGILVSTFYGVELVQRAFHGPNRHEWQVADLNRREALALAPLIAALLWLGLYPQPVIRTAAASLQQLTMGGAGPSAPAARVPLVSRPAATARGGMLAPTWEPEGPKSALRLARAAPYSLPGGGPPCGMSQPIAPIVPAGKAARPSREEAQR
ncbi:MAG TPA: NADH-quinone oxidoreductase subunit M [Terriglobales bacterium]|nr:NADH-quinone oxidoreductase subunit M [Terriglobales bacterium]